MYNVKSPLSGPLSFGWHLFPAGLEATHTSLPGAGRSFFQKMPRLLVMLGFCVLALTPLSTWAQSTPTGVAATAGEKQSLLTWTPVSGATGYNVYRSTTSGSYSSALNTSPFTANFFIDTGLTNGTTYYYEVTAIVSSTESAKSSQVSAAPLAQDSNWTVTPPSGSSLPAPTVSSNATSVSVSLGTTLIASAVVAGTTTTQVNSSSEANCAGTWTFTWTGTGWPTLYVVQHTQHKLYQAIVSAGTGTAQVSNTGGSVLVSAAQPTTASQVISGPATTLTFDTSDLTMPILTVTTASHMTGGMPTSSSGWSDALDTTTASQTAYTSSWFQAHFATPGSIVLTFTVTTSDVTSTANLSSSTSSGLSSAAGTVSDEYSGS